MSVKLPEIGSSGAYVIKRRDFPYFTSMFKYASMPNTRQSLVQFCSATSLLMKKMWKLLEGGSNSQWDLSRLLAIRPKFTTFWGKFRGPFIV